MSDESERSSQVAFIEREQRKLERAKEKAKALEANLTKALAAGLRAHSDEFKAEIVKQVRRAESGQLTDVERKMINAAQQGVYMINHDEHIDGFEEMRKPWLKDDDE